MLDMEIIIIIFIVHGNYNSESHNCDIPAWKLVFVIEIFFDPPQLNTLFVRMPTWLAVGYMVTEDESKWTNERYEEKFEGKK